MNTPTPPPARWYHQPILWLGLVLFAASLAGCIWLIVLAERHADPPVPTDAALFDVPLAPAAAESS
ncbi:MAG: hypothetical protein LBE21_09640, partial [Pseudomonadales bacterium]|nr:hypothetical protein [Pseudomonadales bacterium]